MFLQLSQKTLEYFLRRSHRNSIGNIDEDIRRRMIDKRCVRRSAPRNFISRGESFTMAKRNDASLDSGPELVRRVERGWNRVRGRFLPALPARA